MKKAISAILACVLCMALASTAFAHNYDFASGGDTLASFGRATNTDEPISPDPTNQNIRRDKDAALLPPPYFHGSGDIPTEPSNLYHTQLTVDSGQLTVRGTSRTQALFSDYAPLALSALNQPTVATDTAPRYYPDGSIGSIYVARTGKTMTVYEGESLGNLKKGAGHFASTTAWNGNVALCGHNRGSWPYFDFVKDLQIGDRITYTTPYGVRAYEVFNKERIGEYDHSKLAWSSENLLTLITCIANAPDLRWAAQCREVSHN